MTVPTFKEYCVENLSLSVPAEFAGNQTATAVYLAKQTANALTSYVDEVVYPPEPTTADEFNAVIIPNATRAET